jgi:hypothetical protein
MVIYGRIGAYNDKSHKIGTFAMLFSQTYGGEPMEILNGIIILRGLILPTEVNLH